MDENTLESSIKTYRQQLEQVNTVLRSAGTDGQDELLQLKKDLEEVIQLTEESLLSLKKSQLIGLVEDNAAEGQPDRSDEGSTPGGSVTLTMDEEYEAFKLMLAEDLKDDDSPSVQQNHQENGAAMADEDRDSGDDDDEYDDDDGGVNNVDLELQEEVAGTKCSLMYSQEWGAKERHNAVILELEPSIKQDNEIRVRVLFCNPTHQSMRPCPFFLDGKCKFSPEDCRFSHGHIISLSELSEYQEPDFSTLEVGSKCLARYHSDHIWYPAEVDAVDKKSHKYTVKFESYGDSAVLGPEDILPRESHHSVSSSDDEDLCGVDADQPSTSTATLETDSGETEAPIVAWRTLPGVSLGSWEEHTRGIGSRLMAMMGYEYGQGLGRYNQGRTEIVEAVIMPPGRSLDKCMELRQKNKCKVVGEKQTKSKGKHYRTSGIGKKVREKRDVFAFINTELKGRKAKISELLKENFELVKTDKRSLGTSKSEPSSGRKINIQLVKTQEEITNTKKEIVRLKQSMDRNEKDKKTRQQIEYKIQQKQIYLESLLASEKKLERQQTSRSHHRKLTVF